MDAALPSIVWWAAVIGAYLILFFLALFMLLPVGLSEDDPPGVFVPGAPVRPKSPPKVSLRTKFLWAAAIATALWLVLAALVVAGVIQL